MLGGRQCTTHGNEERIRAKWGGLVNRGCLRLIRLPAYQMGCFTRECHFLLLFNLGTHYSKGSLSESGSYNTPFSHKSWYYFPAPHGPPFGSAPDVTC